MSFVTNKNVKRHIFHYAPISSWQKSLHYYHYEGCQKSSNIKEILQYQHKLNAMIMKRHYHAGSCPAYNTVRLLNSSLKISRLSYCLYFLDIYSRNIDVYDDIKIETSLCVQFICKKGVDELFWQPSYFFLTLSISVVFLLFFSWFLVCKTTFKGTHRISLQKRMCHEHPYKWWSHPSF